MPTRRHAMWLHLGGTAAALVLAAPTAAQVRLDRADPTIVEQALPRPATTTAPAPNEPPRLVVDPSVLAEPGSIEHTGTITAVVLDGAEGMDVAPLAAVYADVVGREPSRADLARFVARIAAAAREAGYPLASASIGAQTIANGILHVQLDPGRIDAVRVIGARSGAADALLGRALVTGRAPRRRELEQALLLVGDLPGVRVTGSQYVRQNGFGILLVTIESDRANAYAQVDNRGSSEIGPVRSTLLANVRNVAQSGDEFALLAAQTPLQPTEFAFVRGRYSAPVDHAGSVLSVSASYGRSHPGASLQRLDVIGHSVDAAVAYTRPLLRSRTHSLWANAEFRSLSVEQTLAGRGLRDDRLTTLTGSLNGFAPAGPGVLRGEVGTTVGLPFGGVTHEGDARTSRADGDARFVTAGYTVDWTVSLLKPVTMVIASSGQIASRPLLATIELGAGGPGFGRGYDYAERTGDRGILGSLELRADAGRIVPGIIDRLQLYTFVDGGEVGNLRGGVGGGTLLSSGGGARLGVGATDGMIEVALPLNTDRFDTGDRSPRVSLRLSRVF